MEQTRPLFWRGAVGALLLALGGCGGTETSPSAPAPPSTSPPATGTEPLPSASTETELLDAVYPIDVETVEAVFDVFPGEGEVRVWSATTFRMRPGQDLPVVHFEPLRTGSQVALNLNGEDLDPQNEADVRIFRYDTSGQYSAELQRIVGAGITHRLEASHVAPMSDAFGRFFTDVNDFEGHGNERLFPTVNSPRDLVHHVLTFRVHDAPPYQMVGSGLVSPGATGDVQEWVLETEREVASYTVMFFLAPDADVDVAERRIQDVDVRIMSPKGGPSIEVAFADLEIWLADLQENLGPFPMPRGVSIVLTPGGGGMEYYGGTITSMRALRHEIFHMYYACSTVATTYRDSWWDEAINVWYELSVNPSFPPIPADFRSGIVGARTPVTVGFDLMAYDEGSRIFQAVALEIGGREAAVEFFSHLHRTRLFRPFTTQELLDELQTVTGADFHARFDQWVYSGAGATSSAASPWAWIHRVDTTPPEEIRRRYGR